MTEKQRIAMLEKKIGLLMGKPNDIKQLKKKSNIRKEFEKIFGGGIIITLVVFYLGIKYNFIILNF